MATSCTGRTQPRIEQNSCWDVRQSTNNSKSHIKADNRKYEQWVDHVMNHSGLTFRIITSITSTVTCDEISCTAMHFVQLDSFRITNDKHVTWAIEIINIHMCVRGGRGASVSEWVG